MKNIKIKFIAVASLLLVGVTDIQISASVERKKPSKPNFIVIFADDLGYGDLGVYGHPNIKTPNLDKMAFKGQKWTNFYAASSVCSPSRAALLTGRLPIRTGITGVLFPNANTGLPQSEISVAKVLKENGYKTAAIGKWHLGHKSPFLPTDHGFESYFGIPYSNDMNREEEIEGKDWIDSQIILSEQEKYIAYKLPLLRNDKVIEMPVDQRTITKRYTEEVITKIKTMKGSPFFLYLAHSLPHIPLFRSQNFKNVSNAGIYGDVVEEIDWSVGQILKTLKEEGLDENTLVIFTSDNGPWQTFKTHSGSGGLLQGAKGGTFEGGFRVPAIFSWPGKIEPNVVMQIGSTMDLMPTFCNLSGSPLPKDRIYDGIDISNVLLKNEKILQDAFFYYRGDQVYAVRKGEYKAHFITRLDMNNIRTSLFVSDPEIEISKKATVLEIPLLYNLHTDPSEKYNIAKDHPEIIAEIRKLLKDHESTIIQSISKKE
jgi:arylsulfatase A-like enzyme